MSDFINSIVEIAGKINKAIDGYLVPITGIARDFIQLIDMAKEVVDTDDVAKLQQLRDDLEAKVMAHADKTEATLRGSD
jgi:hypothetical protein